MSLRWKIALSLAAVGVVVTVALGVSTYRTTESRLVSEVDQSIAQAGLILVARNDRFPNQREEFDVYSVRRLDRTGSVTGTTFDVSVPVDPAVFAEVVGLRGATSEDSVTADDGTRFRVHTIGLTGGAVQIARSLDETDAVLADLRRRTATLVALAALTSALVGWVIAGRVAAPLRRLARSADEVSATGRLDVALPAVGANDRDEVGQLTRAFATMLDALGRSRADQERLVQDAGHELRTPLTSMRTNLAVLRRHHDMPAEMRADILDDLDGEVTELTDLVNEVVTAASGELATQPAELIDLAAMATSVAERVGRRRNREVSVEAEPESFVSIPRAGIDRAMANVVDNACKFDASGQPIELTVTSTGELVGFRVADHGPGIPSDDLDRVFDRFHRTDATRAMPGSGLGLAIVRDVVTSHGGAVTARNREGGGAVIGFDLPAAR